jgi:hypothetical protein
MGDKIMSKMKKARFIDEDDVPTPIRKKADWEGIFRSIPAGKARIIDADEAHHTTVRQALKRFQDKGMFTNYELLTRKAGKTRESYIINSRKS